MVSYFENDGTILRRSFRRLVDPGKIITKLDFDLRAPHHGRPASFGPVTSYVFSRFHIRTYRLLRDVRLNI